jgi:hypothetical protein
MINAKNVWLYWYLRKERAAGPEKYGCPQRKLGMRWVLENEKEIEE